MKKRELITFKKAALVGLVFAGGMVGTTNVVDRNASNPDMFQTKSQSSQVDTNDCIELVPKCGVESDNEVINESEYKAPEAVWAIPEPKYGEGISSTSGEIQIQR